MRLALEETDRIVLDNIAVDAALRLQAENSAWQEKPLRLYIEGKGCDGFYYGVSFDQALPEDIHFVQGEAAKLSLVVDLETYEFVKGSQITWVDGVDGAGFLVSNPRHKQFRGKFFRTPAWKQKLAEKQSISH